MANPGSASAVTVLTFDVREKRVEVSLSQAELKRFELSGRRISDLGANFADIAGRILSGGEARDGVHYDYDVTLVAGALIDSDLLSEEDEATQAFMNRLRGEGRTIAAAYRFVRALNADANNKDSKDKPNSQPTQSEISDRIKVIVGGWSADECKRLAAFFRDGLAGKWPAAKQVADSAFGPAPADVERRVDFVCSCLQR